MQIKGIIFEDTINYKKISMTIMMPKCDFKCDRECGMGVCQNSHLAHSDEYTIGSKKQFIQDYYKDNPLVEALVFQGLEPFDSWEDLLDFIIEFRKVSEDDVVIYTGYNESEITEYIMELKKFPNIIVKFGRFIPNQEFHYDEVLGVQLASLNQYGKKIS